jgi:hypothetical protein
MSENNIVVIEPSNDSDEYNENQYNHNNDYAYGEDLWLITDCDAYDMLPRNVVAQAPLPYYRQIRLDAFKQFLEAEIYSFKLRMNYLSRVANLNVPKTWLKYPRFKHLKSIQHMLNRCKNDGFEYLDIAANYYMYSFFSNWKYSPMFDKWAIPEDEWVRPAEVDRISYSYSSRYIQEYKVFLYKEVCEDYEFYSIYDMECKKDEIYHRLNGCGLLPLTQLHNN